MHRILHSTRGWLALLVFVGRGLIDGTPASSRTSLENRREHALLVALWKPIEASAASNVRRVVLRSVRPLELPLHNGGQQQLRSVLDVRRRLTYGDFAWDDVGVPAGQRWVRVDLEHQLISVFRGGHEIGTSVIIYGAEDKPTPKGYFRVLQKARDYHSRTYDAEMPYMLRLTADGVGLHASSVRARAATHGCIGTPPEFARRMFREIELGDPVTVIGRH